ncbi:hypothetical protein H2198_000857 [Neophaeococcomyces mojaviensis]|uniref:Uncharacterized protein n=1 Tax=Neophaeococcomyces mojaviensis TaxID=3383035 RepID=A0ACC3AJI1_9EURO|nr:hypothetical protein H2198_000857 [Knufia sp. JES_112]
MIPMILSSVSRLRHHSARNFSTFRRQPFSEVSGALGDLGTFLPLLIALATSHAISLSTTLILTGFFNIATGVFFGIPLPVQPMKAIAAVAILKGMSAGEVAAAGIFVGGVIGILSITRLLEFVTRWVPVPVVKGIQVGAGLSLVLASGTKSVSELGWIGPSWGDNRLWIVVTFLALLTVNLGGRLSRVPFALIVTITGIIFGIILTVQSGDRLPAFRVWKPHSSIPDRTEWRTGIIDAGLGQLPLTTLNSIIAVTHLAADLLPEVETPTVTAIGLSVAAMNLIGCWFGGMPVCHGSGGLAAQYKFGARSGASIIFLGVLKLLLGLVFGNSLTGLLNRFPTALLTVMVIAAGLELVSVGESLNSTTRARDLKESMGRMTCISEEESKERWSVMIVTAGLLLAFKNDAVGFLAGMCCHYSYILAHQLNNRSSTSSIQEQQPLLS